ncbi:hypothetical protein, partial [Methanothrix sp.]|uniref:hypothetical protein n=1 Tax=Methanothrix sp. TaxID=90426 RepID=UPI0034E1DB7D
MTREKSTYPFADLVAAFFRIWPRTREVERISSWEFSKSSQAIIALASSWLGISWGVFVAYTIGRESIEAWTLALVLVLLIGTHAYFFYALPRMLDTLSEKIGKIGDAAIMKLISEE